LHQKVIPPQITLQYLEYISWSA